MRAFYVVIDQDDDRELVYNPTKHSYILDIWADMQRFPKWTFEQGGDQITIYGVALYHMPTGENREEMEQRATAAIDLAE